MCDISQIRSTSSFSCSATCTHIYGRRGWRGGGGGGGGRGGGGGLERGWSTFSIDIPSSCDSLHSDSLTFLPDLRLGGWDKFGRQGVCTPIGAVLTAETGDMTRLPGRGDFFLSVTGSLQFFEVSRDPLEGEVT